MSISDVDLAHTKRVLALCGGIGGAKLALGLYQILSPHALTIIVNTGDDFEHLGLAISPDADTILYTLADLADPIRGWGRANETWHFMAGLRQLGAETWFQLGDRDLAVHVERTRLIREGGTLSAAIAKATYAFGVTAEILPMSDAPVRTIVHTDTGPLPFQQYFVQKRCEPTIRAIKFEGAENAQPTPRIMELLSGSDLRTIVICPSNPYLSVDPILAVPGIRSALAAAKAPIVAVSPIINGSAIKGPTAKIMQELGVPNTLKSIECHYRGLIDALIIDRKDTDDAANLDIPTFAADIYMNSLHAKMKLADQIVSFADELSAKSNFRGRLISLDDVS